MSSDNFYGLLGRTLGHSYSPYIHKALGNTAYELFEKEPDEVDAFVCSEDLGGINVTIPYKRDVLPFCNFVSPSVKEIGAANTLVRRDGKLCAYNTDKLGFIYMVRRAGIDVSGKKTLVLGSGGASLALKAALKTMGADRIITISRSGEDNYENIEKHADAEFVVNATPVGLFPNVDAKPLELTRLPNLSGVMDIVYNPLHTSLLKEAESLGLKTAEGLSMLVAQAVASHELFFGIRTDDEKELDDPRIETIMQSLMKDYDLK